MASTDEAQLLELLASIESTEPEVDELLERIRLEYQLPHDARNAFTEPDEAPIIAERPMSQPGDLWRLGEHLLLCGDATDQEQVRRLFGDQRPSWMWTDPPYGVEYTGRTRRRLTILNDTASDLRTLLDRAFTVGDRFLQEGAPLYVATPAGALSAQFSLAFEAVGWHLHQTLVWVKNTMVLGRSDYQYRHEPILYGWKGKGRPWFGGRDCTSVFEVPRPRRSAEHPTMKPVALIEAHLRNSTARGALGYEPFCGSGSTLIAAERLGRRCAAVELDPRYVDVAVRRWQQYTGEDARLSDGRRFADLEEVRHGR